MKPSRNTTAKWRASSRLTARRRSRYFWTSSSVWTKKNRAEGTYDWYLKHLQSFADYVGPRLTVFKVRAFHVSRWLDKRYVTVGDNYRNGAARAVNRAFNWARKQGLIETNPIVGLERPTFQPREDWLTPEQWEKTIASVPPDDALHDFLWFLHETGCRPVEARTVEARHWDRAHDRFVLERRMSKGHSRQSVIEKRVIRLNERAVEIVRKWALKYPEGPLFRNNRGRPWKRSPLNSRCFDLRQKLGFPLFPYILRHTFCTNALLRGVDPLTVAILLGHKDATMVMRVYNHLVQNNEFLKQKLKQATGEGIAETMTAGN